MKQIIMLITMLPVILTLLIIKKRITKEYITVSTGENFS